MPPLPAALERIATTPIIASEMPAGFAHTSVLRLPADPRYRTLGAVRIDFASAHTTESASFALLKTHAAATRLAQAEARLKTGGLFHLRTIAVGRFAIGVTAKTTRGANTLLRLALGHLRRSER